MFGLSPALLAHQGGWDEVLLIGGPLLAIAGLLLLAKRRVDRVASETTAASRSDTDTSTASGSDTSASSASPEHT